MERARTGIKSLKVGYNKVFGYYLEVSKAQANNVPPEYQRKQTLVTGERFTTPELKDYEARGGYQALRKVLGADRNGSDDAIIFAQVRLAIANNEAQLPHRRQRSGQPAAGDAFALEHGVDAVSQSFVETAADIEAVRAAAKALGKKPFIIAKIERLDALNHFEEILKAADGIMVARGDLGVEVPIEEMAILQKQLIVKASNAGKPVITATQMLESMREHPRPTRAEASDVATAVFEGADAVIRPFGGDPKPTPINAKPVQGPPLSDASSASIRRCPRVLVPHRIFPSPPGSRLC